ncbi:hypothetical protein BKA04_000666 [Cryobacterium mesophilum]|uniref:DUF1353 domain-containing protein n=1 Tax=Terrimesophilobacter mesophilus TaxID=433647 RepID=A0A4R8V811_9MICO|nr:DUF1353 domain-containing protein [Terrimesophilobacter mesophilus]MBB5632443.1 hypothetical protein [Terrimesophilobacter mesophilus]TFB79274.1 DUF1353 domain-containing protein [Terrimesophilobacter mesophilus]
MPYVDADGAPLRVIELNQAPEDGHYFQLMRAIGFREHPGPEDSETNPTHWAPAHHPSDNPGPGNRTDLASVPWVFWSFIASYGRQSAPAILHDHQSELARAMPTAEALRARRADDRLFRVGLRQQKVPLLRAWLMWTVVSYWRYLAHAPIRFAAMTVQTALGAAAVHLAVILSTGHPLWLLLLLAPAVGSLAWRAEAPLLAWGSYGLAVLAPLMVLQTLALIPYWVLEVLVRELVDRPFVDHKPDTQLGPFFRAGR